MKPDELPPDDFMPVQPLDEDSQFTYRKRQAVFPRSALSEEIEAHILHLANRRFTARGQVEKESPDEEGHGGGGSGNYTSGDEVDMKPRMSTEADSTDSEMEESQSESETKIGQQGPDIRIVPTADDDTSSALLKPAVSDIVTKLEKTLTVLHNMMAATTQATDSEESEDEETELDEPPLARSRSRPRKRASKRPRPPSALSEAEPSDMPPLASPLKKPRYASAPPAPDDPEEPSTPAPLSREPSPKTDELLERILRQRAVRLNRPAPRDWRTVLGAASLAGFPQGAVQRAAQRCANLFGEGLELQVLNDHSSARDRSTTILPGGEISLGEDDRQLAEIARMRLAARDAARANEVLLRSRSGTARSRTPASRSRTRSRSRSATPHLVCPHRTCPRSVDPFSRRGGLMRHLELVHGGDEGAGVEVDSEDEMEGGVHVDGFLRKIRAKKGWRGQDVKQEGPQEERGRGRTRKRGRSVKVEDETEDGYCFSGGVVESD